jgi:hypothetical protein
MFTFAALAVIVAFGISGQAQAQGIVGQNPHLKLTVAGHIPPAEGVTPDVNPPLVGGSLSLGVLPPTDGSGNPEWPCFGGDTDCSGIAAGGWVQGVPLVVWSKADCKNTVCAQLLWWFQDNSTDTTDDLIITLEVKQGTKVIMNTGPLDFGPNAYTGDTVYLTSYAAFGTAECAVGTCHNPATGEAVLTATVQVGSSTAHSTLDFLLK